MHEFYTSGILFADCFSHFFFIYFLYAEVFNYSSIYTAINKQKICLKINVKYLNKDLHCRLYAYYPHLGTKDFDS